MIEIKDIEGLALTIDTAAEHLASRLLGNPPRVTCGMRHERGENLLGVARQQA